MDIRFLSLADVLTIHADQITRYGGKEGVHNQGLLESAINQPTLAFEGEYAHEDLHAMAAAYLFHIVQNNPFIDGNKRTGAVAALVFLMLNNTQVDLQPGELYSLTIGVASSKTSKSTVADELRQRARSHP